MRDPYWLAAWTAIEPYLHPGSHILLPPGEWPEPPCRVTIYRDVLEPGDATIILLHKGKLGAIKKAALRYLMASWRCVFANEVFVCFVRGRGRTPEPARLHIGRLFEYLRSRNLKRIRGTVYFIHLPKAAGTSVWSHLCDRVPSSLYYDTLQSFLHNPPRRGEFDLIGGHIPLPLIAPLLGEDDRIACVMREPTARFRSAFLHSRRPGEDPATFSHVMRAMREKSLAEFLATRDGKMEARQQLLMLGHDLTGDYTPAMDPEIHTTALRWMRDPRALFRTVERLEDFIPPLSDLLNIPASGTPLPSHNATAPNVTAASLAEFEEQRPAIEAENVLERALYEVAGEERMFFF